MTINDFLDLPNPEIYDFSNNKADDKYQTITDPIKKYFVYKAYFIARYKWYLKNGNVPYPEGLAFRDCTHKKYKSIIDPDTNSPLLQDIYNSLWDKKHLVHCTYRGNITGETLNSVQTTLNSTLKEFNMGTYFRRYGNYSINYAIALFKACRDTFTNELGSVPKLKEFLSIYHTLGNFMPVPVGCNSPRGFQNTDIEDYWDITLKIIYEYFTEKDDGVALIIKKCPKLAEKYKKWLDSFIVDGNRCEGWQNFVKENYLQAFVSGNEDQYGRPKELWDNHFLNWESDHKKGVKPGNKKDIEQFYDRACEMILARGNQMRIALEEMKDKENRAKVDK